MEDKKLVPALRFGEFKEEWLERDLSSLTSLITKGTTPKSFAKSGINYVKIECLDGINIIKDRCVFIDKTTHENELKRSILEKDDILFAIAGATLGKIGIVTDDIIPANTNQALAIIRLSDKNQKTFILNILASTRMKKYIFQSMSVGAQPNLSLRQINEFAFNLPESLPEQQKIATFLTATDQRLQLLQQKKAKLEDYKKGLMQKLFSQELRFKDEEGKVFGDWEEKKLGEIATFSKGKGISKSDIVEGGTLQCIRYGELYTEYSEVINEIKSTTNLNPEKLILSEANDVIIPASGETQIDIATAACVLKKGVALSGDINIIKSPLDGVFLSFYLNTAKKIDIARLAQGISVVHLYSSQLKTLIISFPSLHEQQKIATFLTSIDQSIEKLTTQINQTITFKKGLLQKMFV